MKIYIQILNKNNNQIFTANENVVFTDNYNETLDSMKLRISHLPNEIDIEPFDTAIITTSDNSISRFYCVDQYVMTQDAIGIDNETFSYEISLFSQTKLLEGIICPNLSITPHRVGTKRSIWFYLNLYLNLYGTKIRVERTTTAFENAWAYDESVETKFNAIECPEMQWNAPTLREVITDLMMVADCIPVMDHNIIGFIDLTKKKRPIQNYNYLQKSQSSENYVSELKMNMQNVLQTQIDGIRNTSTTTEYLRFESNDYLITSENIELHTTFPILNIKHLWMMIFIPSSFTVDIDPTPTTLFKTDLCDINGENFVKEYQEYITLNVAYRLVGLTGDKSEYQNYCIYYNRGGNQITGFSNVTKRFIWSTDETIDLLKDIVKQDAVSKGVVPSNYYVRKQTNDYYSVFFQIEYETMTDQVFSASKDKKTNKRVVIDNQTNSWVDAYSQGNLEYQKANRLGNQTIMYNQRVDSLEHAIKIGDYRDDVIIYQVQYQIFTDHIEVNAFGTKDYILRNYWTGINSKIRTWVNAKDEAMIRHELEKYYCQLSFDRHDETNTETQNIAQAISDFIQATNEDTSLKFPIKYALVRTTLENGYQPSTNFFTRETISRIIGNSYVFTVGFNDNYEAGRVVKTTGNDAITRNDIETGQMVMPTEGRIYYEEPIITSGVNIGSGKTGIPTEPLKYVDDKGEFVSIDTTLHTNILVAGPQTQMTELAQKDFYMLMLQRPIIENASALNKKFNSVKTYQKDNKEIFKVSYQFEIYTEENDLFFTKYLLANNPIIFDEPRQTETKVYSNMRWREDGILPPYSTLQQYATITKTALTNNTVRVDITVPPLTENVFLCDSNDNVMIGITRSRIDDNNQITFYLNILLDRDLSIYDTNSNKIGEI